MGLTKVTTKLTNIADPEKSYEDLFLVDTGATDSMAPRDELEKVGIRQAGKTAYPLRRFADAARRTRLPLAALE
jgi:hypothetical protein